MENTQTQKEYRGTLLLSIEAKKRQYVKERRPVLWYGYAVSVVVLLFILGIIVVSIFGNNTSFQGWGIFICFVCGFILLFQFPVFFIIFAGIARIKELMDLKEEIEDLRTELHLLEEAEIQQHSPRQRYRDELTQTMIQYRRQANGYRRTHYTFQIFIIFFSLLVTMLTSALNGFIGFSGILWITPIISGSVSFLTALTTLFRFHDRGYNLQQTADAIEFEVKTADLHIFDYSDLSDDEVLHRLAERGERLRDEQRKRQQLLEQSSNTKQAPSKS